MSQINHEIKIQEGFGDNHLLYYLNFEDYLTFTEKSDLYKTKNDLLYINLRKIFYKYNLIRNINTEFGLLHVVNIQRALGLFNRYVLLKDDQDLESCVEICDSILGIAVCDDKYLKLIHEFDHPGYALRSGWVSAMAQGMFASLLLRIFFVTKIKKYYEAAFKALEFMLVPLENGGTCKEIGKGFWFLEYPRCSFIPFVLNGNIFSVLGMYDFYRYDRSLKNVQKFDNALNSIADQLKYYAGNNFSYYDRLGTHADESYNKLHINQLKILFQITGNNIFQRYADLFLSYSHSYSNSRKMSFTFKSFLRFIFKLITFFVYLTRRNKN